MDLVKKLIKKKEKEKKERDRKYYTIPHSK
jgi:hypothetical protein